MFRLKVGDFSGFSPARNSLFAIACCHPERSEGSHASWLITRSRSETQPAIMWSFAIRATRDDTRAGLGWLANPTARKKFANDAGSWPCTRALSSPADLERPLPLAHHQFPFFVWPAVH